MKDLATTDRIALARSLFDAFAAGDLDQWEANLAPDFTYCYPGVPDGRGRAAARAYNVPFNDACSGWRIEVTRSADNGRTVFLELVVHATLTGPLVTPAGTLPATGLSAAVPCVLMVDIEGGRICHEATYWNVPDLLAQIVPAG